MVKNLLLAGVLLFIASIGFGQNPVDCDDCPTAEVKENTIFPNPADDVIRINASNNAVSFTIYNVVGRKVKSYEIEKNKSYEVSSLPKGMYLVQLLTKNNKVITTLRLHKR